MSQLAVIFGSKSDLKYWEESKKYIEYFNISFDLIVLSAHRTPEEVSQIQNSKTGQFLIKALMDIKEKCLI